MSAHERLRQLHAKALAVSGIADAVIIDALPQLANLAEAAANLIANNGGHTTWANSELGRALADLEQALNPTRNTQSPT